MKRLILFAAAIAMTLSLGTTSFAQSKVGGDVDIKVKTGHVATVAAGLGNKAETSIGSIEKSKVGGDVNIKVKTGHVATVAAGLGNKAETSIGAIK
jgi:hypothetical protein